MKPVDVKSNTYIDSSKEINNKNPKFKIGDTIRILNIKTFLRKVTLHVGQKKFLWLQKLKILCPWDMLLMILTGKKLDR